MNSDLPRHQRPTNLKKFLFGCEYYPDHWSEDDKINDPQWMAEAGLNAVRLGDLAWAHLEPRRGEFNFSLFDRTIEKLANVGISTILCTPTAAPPRWLTAANENVLRVDEHGQRMTHGSRQHCCTTNEEFRAESRRITQALAEHYAGNPHVIGWQTDNEFHCHVNVCYCPACIGGFQNWLRQKYGTIERLNAAHGNIFYSLTYGDFDQVVLPTPNVQRPWLPNPSLELDFYRFTSDAVIEFQRQQVQILRRANQNWFVTHNGVWFTDRSGMYQHTDYWKFTEDLDFLSFDIYPAYSIKGPDDSYIPAITLERCRAMTGGFIVPEQQGGTAGVRNYLLQNPQPGQMRLWAYQSIAHGADGVLHFLWRSCRFGCEQHAYGIIDHDNVRRRRYTELAQEGKELAQLGDKILHSVLDVQAGVLVQTDQDDAHAICALGMPSPSDQTRPAYNALWTRHLPCGLISADDSFAGLKLLVLPSFLLMDDTLAGKLTQFVSDGGVLLATARTATKNRDNHAIAQTPPGLLAGLFGVKVEEFGSVTYPWPLAPAAPANPLYQIQLKENQASSSRAFEILSLHGAQAVGTWITPPASGPNAAAGQPAITVNRFGKGHAIYVGTHLTAENASCVIDLALKHASIPPLAEAPAAVEAVRRHKLGTSLLFVLNHYPRKEQAKLFTAGTDLITGNRCEGSVELPPYGVAVIQEHRAYPIFSGSSAPSIA